MTETMNDEFSGKNVAKGLLRTALLFGAIFLCVLTIIPFVGIFCGIAALALLGWGIAMNWKDPSRLKWANIGFKVVLALVTLWLLILNMMRV